ncbi:hypothetical protein F1880_006173 [Penicillium rolfsii]|nr:hypothetical protein F1880_006173 [Penicillium rolfsii]
MDPAFDEDPVWITKDDARSNESDKEESNELPAVPHPPEPEAPKCGEILRITRPENGAVDTESGCLVFGKPKLSCQLRQCSSWNGTATFPVFNLWRPASYVGTTLTQLGPNPVKLNNNDDLIVTNSDEDTENLKSNDTEAVVFTEGNIVAAIDIDRPGLFCCSVCYSCRGKVLLANGERWTFNEIEYDYYSFAQEDNQSDADGKANAKSLMWMYYHGSRPELVSGVPEDLPFAMDRYTRICRVKRKSGFSDGFTEGPVLAVMNRDGIVCCQGMEKNQEIATNDIRELVLTTALTIAQYEKWL